MNGHTTEVEAGRRFEFGKNWRHYLRIVNEERIKQAEKSLKDMLAVDNLRGKRFLDIGSGSGLFSLAARRLGARVHSLDYDPEAVVCTSELKRRYLANDTDWTIEQASVLDTDHMKTLGGFDVVYSWGVLHHTGAMWEALDNVVIPVTHGGTLLIAIYNDQGWLSRYWRAVKKTYNTGPVGRLAVVLIHAPYLLGGRFLVRLAQGRLRVERGMSLWHDMIDWLGGYPFETATPEKIVAFYRERAFEPLKVNLCGRRHGCNEFVFRKECRDSSPLEVPQRQRLLQ